MRFLEYEANGNITVLSRYGTYGGEFGQTDFLQMSYAGNRLTGVYDVVGQPVSAGTFGFRNGTGQNRYGYDKCGSLLHDANRGIALIDYDDRGMPVRIQFTDGSVTEHVYASDGRRLRMRHLTAVEGLSVALKSRHELTESETLSKDSVDYMGNFQVIGNRVRRFDFADGYATYRQNVPAEVLDFHFFVRDHQGSVTAVIGRESAEQLTRYYPFGGLMTQDCMGERVSADKYTGKRLDRMHGLDWYDFGARQYDQVYGRFAGIDPLCEKYPHLSPYAYCGNDPVNAIDVDGDSIIYRIPNWQSRTFDNYYWDVSSSCFLDSNGNPFSGSDDMLSSIQNALIQLQKGETGKELINNLSTNHRNVLIMKSKQDNHEGEGDELYTSVVWWNPNKGGVFGGRNFISLAHELAHAWDRILGTINLKKWYSVYNSNGKKVIIPKAEIFATHYENLIRIEQGLSLRTHYSQDILGNPDGGVIIKNGNQSIYFDMSGNHKRKYGKIHKNNYSYITKE